MVIRLKIIVMERKVMNLVILPEEEWNQIRSSQNEILALLKDVKADSRISINPYGYITAMEFMKAVRIRRTKFDQLVQSNKIRIIKKLRKIYVPVTEIDRYFKDSTIP